MSSSVRGKGNAAAILDLLPDLLMGSPWNEYFKDFCFPWTFLDVEEYRSMVEDAGLSMERIELVPKENRFTKDGLKGWAQSTWIPYLERLPESLRERFLQELVDRYFEAHPPDAEGKSLLPFMRLEVQAIK